MPKIIVGLLNNKNKNDFITEAVIIIIETIKGFHITHARTPCMIICHTTNSKRFIFDVYIAFKSTIQTQKNNHLILII